MAQHVIVTEYNNSWPHMFSEEAAKIRRILGDNCTEIYHIGSTSVKGLAAKPVIDIMPVVKSLLSVDSVSSEFEKIGYEYLGEFGIPGRRYLRKGGDNRTHQIHIFEKSDFENINRHLAFRDFLRARPDVRDRYSALKKELANAYPYDIESYCDGKDEFVKKYEAEALSVYAAEKQR